jgi:hypothetical protein
MRLVNKHTQREAEVMRVEVVPSAQGVPMGKDGELVGSSRVYVLREDGEEYRINEAYILAHWEQAR